MDEVDIPLSSDTSWFEQNHHRWHRTSGRTMHGDVIPEMLILALVLATQDLTWKSIE
jgi:hypothetical protein